MNTREYNRNVQCHRTRANREKLERKTRSHKTAANKLSGNGNVENEIGSDRNVCAHTYNE